MDKIDYRIFLLYLIIKFNRLKKYIFFKSVIKRIKSYSDNKKYLYYKAYINYLAQTNIYNSQI